jgi:hypothetical protein
VKEEDPPEEDNNGGGGGYKPMEVAICRSILISEVEDRAKSIGLEEAIQLSQKAAALAPPTSTRQLSSFPSLFLCSMCGRRRRSSLTSATRTRCRRRLQAISPFVFLVF